MDRPTEENTVPLRKGTLLGLLALSICLSTIPLAYKEIAIAQGRVRQNSWALIVCLLASYVLMLLIVSIVHRSSRVIPGFQLQWVGPKGWSTLIAAILFLIGTLAIRELLRYLWPGPVLVLRERVLLMPPFGTAFLISLVSLYCLVGPVVEEIFWRGYIQQGLEKVMRGSVAVILQASIFAAFHYKQVAGIPVAFLCGFVFGLWRWRKQTLIPVIVAHIAWNAAYWGHYLYAQADEQRIRVTHDYRPELETLSRGLITHSEEENAWPHYVQAAALMVEPPAWRGKPDLQTWPWDLSGPQTMTLQAWISSNAKAFAELELGTQKAYCFRDYTKMSTQEIVGVPTLMRCSTLTSLLLARAKLSQISGRLPRTMSDLSTCYRFSDQLQGPKPTNELLCGLRTRIETTRTMMEIAAHAQSNKACLDALDELWRERRAHPFGPISFAAERIVMFDYIQALFTDDGNGDGHIPSTVYGSLMAFPSFGRYGVRAWSKLRRRQTVRQTEDLFDYLDTVAEYTPFELLQTGQSFREGILEIADDNAFLLAHADGLAHAYFGSYRLRAREDGLTVALAVLLYNLENGHLPDELAQLVQEGYLEVIPSDPYGESCLTYKRTDGDFLIYSFGPNFVDDGGVGGAGGDDVFWPVSESRIKTIRSEIPQ